MMALKIILSAIYIIKTFSEAHKYYIMFHFYLKRAVLYFLKIHFVKNICIINFCKYE